MSFGGIRACQITADYWLWEAILNGRETNAIVELGTFHGGFSHYLAAQARIRGLSFRTYDIIKPPTEIPGFVRADIFAEQEAIGDYLQSIEPVFLLCDGGNKPRELATFSKRLSPISTIFVHDWMDEFLPEHIPDNVEPIYESICDIVGSITRIFKVKDA